MKKLTAGIFATILGLTAVDAFAATAGTTVASTNYVNQAMQAAEATAADYTDTKTTDMATKTWVGEQGYVTSGALDGKGFATTNEVATAKQEAIDAAAEAAKIYIDATELKDSQDAQDVVLKKYADDAVTAGTADAGANYLLQSVKLENGQLAAVTTVEIVDQYPTQQ